MNIIIVGCGKVGTALVQQLSREGHDIAIIDEIADKVQLISNTYDVLGVVGNGSSFHTLSEAGIDEADLLIAVTNSDELNLLCCVIAKKAGDNVATIARVRNPAYFEEISFIKKELDLSMIINPELAAAMEISRLLRFPTAIEINTFAKGRIELLKFRIENDSRLSGMSLIDIENKFRCGILVCAVERGHEVIIPSGGFVLKKKDVVSIVSPPKNSNEFFKKIGLQTHQVKSAMVVGGGEIAFYLARQLLAMGVRVKIIEKEKARCDTLSELLPRAMIINGDGIDQDLLLSEGMKQTEAFVALTNLDEENLLLSLFARSQTDAKLVTKINSITFDQVIESLDLGSIICPKHITAESILQYVRARQNSVGSNVETLYKIVDEKAEALEFAIRQVSPVVGIPLEKLRLKPDILICSINRGGQIIIPRGQDTIEVGDNVIVVTTRQGLDDITDILKNS